MRAKIILPVLLIAFCLVGFVVLYSRISPPATVTTDKASKPASVSATGKEGREIFADSDRLERKAVEELPSPPPSKVPSPAISSSHTAPDQLPAAEQERLIRKRALELYSLAMKDDLASRDEIWRN